VVRTASFPPSFVISLPSFLSLTFLSKASRAFATNDPHGDVRGVLEIIRPLDRDVARVRDDLRGTFALMALISVSLVALTGFILVIGRRRQRPTTGQEVS
jgi:hypothetical protein